MLYCQVANQHDEPGRMFAIVEDPPYRRPAVDCVGVASIAGCLADEVPEIRSLGNTLKAWRPEILNHHRTGRPKGSTCA
jgi:hypothetical protein